jgi:hypothetical protein
VTYSEATAARCAPPPDVAVRLIRQHFLIREDRLCFAPPWDSIACPIDPRDDLEAILRAHLCGPDGAPAVRVRWVKDSEGKAGFTDPGHWRTGSYSPAKDGTTVYLVIDFDGSEDHSAPLADPLAVVLTVYFLAESLGLACYLESSRSGKGWHLWIFFNKPVPASLARRLGFLLAPKDAVLAHGKLASPEAGKGIEVFPKNDRVSGVGIGTQVWLPWYYDSKPGGNQFYRPSPGGGLTPFAPDRLKTATVAEVEEAIRRLEQKGKAQAHAAPVNGEFQSWRVEALGRLPLEDVYGDLLTGKRQGRGWLEARDPNSPSGDRDPSAGVSDGTGDCERGRFKSFIDGRNLSVFDFLVERDRAPGFREALRLVADLSGVPLPNGRVPPGGEGQHRTATAVQIIRDYFAERYRPLFKRGHAIYCADGNEVPMGIACALPDSTVIARLREACDAPRYQGGALKEGALPGFFTKWAKVSWGDLLLGLKDEDEVELGQDCPAPEEFRRMVRDVLVQEVVLGDVIGHTGVRQTERNSLIGWCQKFAKPGPWRSIRGKKCWCKLVEGEGGEITLKVAIRPELFAQVAADRRLRSMPSNTFTRRAEKYGVGSTSRRDRPHGVSALVLADDLVADLVAGIPDEHDEPPGTTP